MILEHLVKFVGALLKHIIGVLLLCWRRMLRAGMIAFAIGVVVTVLIAVVSTGQAIPSVPSLIVALLLGSALAYGVALTVLAEEMILGIIDLLRMIEGDLSAGAHITEVVAEREVGQVREGVRRLFGLPVSVRPPARPGATLRRLTPTQPGGQPAGAPIHPGASMLVEAGAAALAGAAAKAVVTRRAEPSRATAIETAAPETTPEATPETSAEAAPATPSGAPVPADRLPRIEWTYEHEAIRVPAAPGKPATPSAAPDTETSAPAPEATAPDAPSASAGFITRVTGPFAPPDEPLAVAPFMPAPPLTPAPSFAPPPSFAPTPSFAPAPHLAPAAPETSAETSAETPAETPAETSALEAGYEDERLAAPAALVTLDGPAEPAERADDIAEAAEPEAVKLVAPEPPAELATGPDVGDTASTEAVAATPTPMPEPAQPAEERGDTQPIAAIDEPEPAAPEPTASAPEASAPEAPAGEPATLTGRDGSARHTLPLGETDATLETPLAGAPTNPRLSTPESGLWERLSSALISRVGPPSGPFASAPPSLPDDEPDQEPAPGGDA